MGWLSSIINPGGAIAETYQKKEAGRKATSAANQALEKSQGLAAAQQQYQKEQYQPFYDKSLPAFAQYASAITGTPDETGKIWEPTLSPAFKWQQEQADIANRRSLRAAGRENSTFGMNTLARAKQNLLAQEYDKQLNRLASLSDIGRSTAGALSDISGGYQTRMIPLINQVGENTANNEMFGGMLKAQGVGATNRMTDEFGNAALSTVSKLYGGGMK
jgi:hypothetical protein